MKWERLQNGRGLVWCAFPSIIPPCFTVQNTKIFIEKQTAHWVRAIPEYKVSYHGKLKGWELDRYEKSSSSLEGAKQIAKELYTENVYYAALLEANKQPTTNKV